MDREGRAILGGGRYDNLVGAVGGEPLGGIGFAMGDVVIELVLQEYGRKPKLRSAPSEVIVTVFDRSLMGTSARIAALIRSGGVKTELYPEVTKLDKQLKYANAQMIPIAIVIGPDEANKNQATLKDLRSGQQQTIDQDRVAPKIRELLRTGD